MFALAPDTIVHQRYQIVRLVGRGGMGAVYQALDLRLRSHVALKHMTVEGEYLSHAFEHEAQLLANMRHPALPKVIDHFNEAQGQFLVMEYFAGDDLATLLKRRGAPFPVHEVLQWADQILGALEYLHLRRPPVIHRDIKPQNLKLLESGEVILLDFGLAKGHTSQSTRVTTGGSIVGYTPQFAPLEQIEGIGTKPQSDLYSLAATLHHLLTNAQPVDALARASASIRHLPDPLRPIHEVNPLVPPSISGVLQQALALDDSLRPTSATALRQALRAAQQGGSAASNVATVIDLPVSAEQIPVGMAQPAAQVRQSPGEKRRLRWLWPVLGGALVLLGLFGGAVAWALTGTDTTDGRAVPPPPVATAVVEVGVPAADPPAALTSTSEPAKIEVIPTTEPTAVPTVSPTAMPTAIPTPTAIAQALPVRPLRVSASSFAPRGQDSCGTVNSYEPTKATDGLNDTAWRVSGNGSTEWIELSFQERVRVAEIGIIGGFDKIDPCDGTDRFFQGRIIRKVRLEFDSGKRVEVSLVAVRSMQYVTIPDIETQRLRIIILESDVPPANNGRDLIAISEIHIQARPSY